jgi:hypothetical protein
MSEREPQQSQFIITRLEETATSITLRIGRGEALVIFTYSPPGKVVFEVHPPTQPNQEITPEKEKPVKLRGRIGTEIRRKPSPTGGTMAVFSFAEHPNRAIWSYSNTLEKKPEKDTVWWPVAAFDEHVALLDTAAKGREYDIDCFPRSWTDTKEGREITVNGLYLVGIQQFVRRTQQEPPK